MSEDPPQEAAASPDAKARRAHAIAAVDALRTGHQTPERAREFARAIEEWRQSLRG